MRNKHMSKDRLLSPKQIGSVLMSPLSSPKEIRGPRKDGSGAV